MPVQLKHEEFIKRVISTLHEPWMNSAEKEEFDTTMIEIFGAKMDSDIEVGISNGYTEEEQEKAAICALSALISLKD